MKLRHAVAAVLLLYKGIEQAVMSFSGFDRLEEEIGSVIRESGGQVLQGVLESLDDELLAGKAENLEVEGFRRRSMLTTFGEMEIRRRLYKDKVGGKYRFLLDEALGLEEKVRTTPRLRRLAVELSLEVPFRKAAEIIGKTMPHVSAMAVWHATKEAGEKAKADVAGLKGRVFDQGDVPAGTRKTDLLNIEADGVLVRAQRSKKRHEEIKLGVAYEGKEAEGNRVKLKERLVMAGVTRDKGFWEEAVATLGEHWDLSEVKKVRIGADGASWAKAGVEYFSGAEYQLDRFHLRKAMREALGGDTEGYKAVAAAIMAKDQERLAKAIAEAEKKVTGRKREGIRKFELYVLSNWKGIKTGDNLASLGTIEGQVYHQLARRMKRLGARWTTEGADRMARLLATKANDDLDRYLTFGAKQPARPVLKTKPPKEPVVDIDRKATEIGEWLKARVPALAGPHQSRPYVKYALRQIVLASSGVL